MTDPIGNFGYFYKYFSLICNKSILTQGHKCDRINKNREDVLFAPSLTLLTGVSAFFMEKDNPHKFKIFRRRRIL